MLQSVETSLPFLHAIWGQFVLWVASPGLSWLTMGEEEEVLLWAGDARGGQRRKLS